MLLYSQRLTGRLSTDSDREAAAQASASAKSLAQNKRPGMKNQVAHPSQLTNLNIRKQQRKAPTATMQFGHMTQIPSTAANDLLVNQVTLTMNSPQAPPQVGGSKSSKTVKVTEVPQLQLCVANGGLDGWNKMVEHMVDSGLLDHPFTYRSNQSNAQPRPVNQDNVTTIFTKQQLTELYAQEDQDRSRVSRGSTMEEVTNSGEVDVAVQKDPFADDSDSDSEEESEAPAAMPLPSFTANGSVTYFAQV